MCDDMTQADPLKPGQEQDEQSVVAQAVADDTQKAAEQDGVQKPTNQVDTQKAAEHGVASAAYSTTATAGDEQAPPQVEGEEELLHYLEEQRDANRRLTPDEVKKLRRKQRTEEIVSGITDAVTSLSNLYFTSQYAPNMYDHTRGMSEATKARWDKAWKEREAENDRFLDYALKLRTLKAEKEATEYKRQQDKLKAERDEVKLQIEQLKADSQAAKDEVWMKVQLGKMDKEAAEAELARIQADYAQKYGVLMGKQTTITHNGGGGTRTTPYSLTVYGQKEYYNKPQERETAIYGYARELGIPTTTTTGDWSNKKEVKRNINDVAADIERETRGKTRPGGKSGGNGNKSKKHADL